MKHCNCSWSGGSCGPDQGSHKTFRIQSSFNVDEIETQRELQVKRGECGFIHRHEKCKEDILKSRGKNVHHPQSVLFNVHTCAFIGQYNNTINIITIVQSREIGLYHSRTPTTILSQSNKHATSKSAR